jgi:hypothetical protein
LASSKRYDFINASKLVLDIFDTRIGARDTGGLSMYPGWVVFDAYALSRDAAVASPTASGHPMKRDLYAEVSARILADLETGAAPWIKPWSATPGANVPRNAVSNRPTAALDRSLDDH